MKHSIANLVVLSTLCGISYNYLPKSEAKRYKECLLPRCKNLTNHNGGYCCSEHSKEHRKIRKINI